MLGKLVHDGQKRIVVYTVSVIITVINAPYKNFTHRSVISTFFSFLICQCHRTINISKCSVLHLGSHNPLSQYTFNDSPLLTSNSVKDLGITYNHKLQFDVYIQKIVSRALQMVNLIFRSFVSRDVRIVVRAFSTYVRPILEYFTPIWSPYLLKDINKIEGVQRYFTRRLFPEKQYSYAERLVLINKPWYVGN